MNKSIIYKSIGIAVFAILITTAHNASAYVPGVWDPQPRVYQSQADQGFTTVVAMGSNTTPTPATVRPNAVAVPTTTSATPAATNTTSNANTSNTTSNTTASTVKHSTVATTQKVIVTRTSDGSHVESLPVVVSSDVVSTTVPATQVVTTENDLAALSLRGSGGFMPSSFFQWFLVVLLILAIIIIARMIIRHNSHHDVHVH